MFQAGLSVREVLPVAIHPFTSAKVSPARAAGTPAIWSLVSSPSMVPAPAARSVLLA